MVRDPWTNILYLFSGDADSQCFWWYSLDYGATWVLLTDFASTGFETQVLRACNSVFTKDKMYWAVDHGTSHNLNSVVRNGTTGIIDISTRVKIVDLPPGQATNSICYVESPNGIFMFDRIDIGYDSYYGDGLDVQFWDLQTEELKTLMHIDFVAPSWGGHRGKCYSGIIQVAQKQDQLWVFQRTALACLISLQNNPALSEPFSMMLKAVFCDTLLDKEGRSEKMINSADLIAKFRQAQSEGFGYIWGERGGVWTQAKQDKATREQTIKYGQKWVGKKVADCSGLFSWAFKGASVAICIKAATPCGQNTWRTKDLLLVAIFQNQELLCSKLKARIDTT